MELVSLSIERVRNLVNLHIKPSTRMNIIYGENAAGKTAILESIYLLSKARSFRTPRIKDVIQHDQENLIVSGMIVDNNQTIKTGIRKSKTETEIKYNHQPVKTVSEQAKNMVVQASIPENTKIFTGSPKDRRKWVDWALFHVEHDYLKNWHNYYHALRNRNALIRGNRKEEEFFIWEKEMSITAKKMHNMWANYFALLQKYYQEIAQVSPYKEILFSTKNRKLEAEDFLEHLQLTRQSDIKMGFTQYGPHKADFEFKINTKHIAAVFSRGQIKQFMIILSVAQARLLKMEKNISPIVLIDDFNSELDRKTVKIILDLLFTENIQLFITTTDPDMLDFENNLKNSKNSLFHVKHGQIY